MRRLSILFTVFWLLIPAAVSAQPTTDAPTVSLWLRNAPIARALNQAFEESGVTYRFDGLSPDAVQGAFSGRLDGVTLAEALDTILRIARPKCTWQVDRKSGEYVILTVARADALKKAAPPPPPAEAGAPDNGKSPAPFPRQDAQLVLNTGHSSRVNSLFFSPNGRILVTESRDATILWDVASHLPISQIYGNRPWQFTRDSHLLYCADTRDRQPYYLETGQEPAVWDVAAEHYIPCKVDTDQRVFRFVVSPRGDTAACVVGNTVSNAVPGGPLYSASGSFHVLLVDFPSGTIRRILGAIPVLPALTFSPNGTYLLADYTPRQTQFPLPTRQMGAATVWNTDTGSVALRCPGTTVDIFPILPGIIGPSVKNFAFSPNEKYLISHLLRDGSWEVWNLAEGKSIVHWTAPQPISYIPAASNPTSSGANRTTHFSFMTTIIPRTQGKNADHGAWISGFLFHSDGRHLLTFRGEHIDDYNLEDGPQPPKAGATAALRSQPYSAALASASPKMDNGTLVAANRSGTIRILDPEKGSPLQTLQTNRSDGLATIAFSPDGNLYAITDEAYGVLLRDRRTETNVAYFRRNIGPIDTAQFSADGAALVARRLTANGTSQRIRFDLSSGRGTMVSEPLVVPDYRWSTTSARLDSSFDGISRYRRAVTSPDGSLRVDLGEITGKQAPDLIQQETGHVVISLYCPPVEDGVPYQHSSAIRSRLLAAAFSPDNQKLALVWSAGGEYSFASNNPYPVTNYVAFLQLLDAHTGHEIRHWEFYGASNLSPLFQPGTGRLYLSGSMNLHPSSFSVAPQDAIHGLIRINMDTGNLFAAADDPVCAPDLAFSPDGHLAASFGMTPTLYETTNWKPVTQLKESGIVHSLAFRSDGRRMVTSGEDGRIRLWNAEDGAEIARFVATDSGEFLISTPDDYYTASRSAGKVIAFRANDEAGEPHTYPFEQFDLKLNRPDIVLERIGYADAKSIELQRRLYLKRLKQMGYDEAMLGGDFHVPVLRVDDRSIPFSTRVDTLTFHLHATDSREPLDRIEVRVNGVPAFGRDGYTLRDKATTDWSGDLQVKLSAGANRVQVSVRNHSGAESRRQSFSVFHNPVQPHPATLYVVAAGVSKYADARVPSLSYAAKDAADIAAYFGQQASRRAAPGKMSPLTPFAQVKTLVLGDDRATRETILHQATAFVAQAQPDDTVIVFFSGHGVMNSTGDYYFLCHDAKIALSMTSRTAEIAGGALSFEEIENLMYATPSRRKLLLLDSCHSGEADREELAAAQSPGAGSSPSAPALMVAAAARHLPNGVTVRALDFAETGQSPIVIGGTGLGFTGSIAIVEDLFANLKTGSGATVISASGWQEYAWETGALKNGLFTHTFLGGLRSRAADANGDGQISVSELRGFVTRRVLELSNGGQRPSSRQENLDADFPID